MLFRSITAFAGHDDRIVSIDSIRAWAEHTTHSFRMRVLAGDHFFVHSARGTFLEAVSQDLIEQRSEFRVL